MPQPGSPFVLIPPPDPLGLSIPPQQFGRLPLGQFLALYARHDHHLIPFFPAHGQCLQGQVRLAAAILTPLTTFPLSWNGNIFRGLYFCHRMYSGPFVQTYGAWVLAEVVRTGHAEYLASKDAHARRGPWTKAENKIRGRVGVPAIGEKFISETTLFKIVSYLFKGRDVIHHYRAAWLGRQELDIFVPSLELAIEYQGEQHFQPVTGWGGEEALAATQQRDVAKRHKCQAHLVRCATHHHDRHLRLASADHDAMARASRKWFLEWLGIGGGLLVGIFPTQRG